MFHKRLPARIRTELSKPGALPYSIYSDAVDALPGSNVRAIDILQHIAPEVQQDAAFAAYHEIRKRKALGASLDDPPVKATWHLDKYKFLPLTIDALHRYPDLEWLISSDGDTYLFQQHLSRYLRSLDSRHQHLLGNHLSLSSTGPQWFAHGGSGYVISRGLLNLALGTSNLSSINAYAGTISRHDPNGDSVLARTILSSSPEINIPNGNVTTKWLFQGSNQNWLELAPLYWTAPLFSLHHMSSADVLAASAFEDHMASVLPADGSSLHCGGSGSRS